MHMAIKNGQGMLNTKAQDAGYFGDRMGSETEDIVIRKGPMWSSEATGGYTTIIFITAPHFSLHTPKLLGSTHFPLPSLSSSFLQDGTSTLPPGLTDSPFQPLSEFCNYNKVRSQSPQEGETTSSEARILGAAWAGAGLWCSLEAWRRRQLSSSW